VRVSDACRCPFELRTSKPFLAMRRGAVGYQSTGNASREACALASVKDGDGVVCPLRRRTTACRRSTARGRSASILRSGRRAKRSSSEPVTRARLRVDDRHAVDARPMRRRAFRPFSSSADGWRPTRRRPSATRRPSLERNADTLLAAPRRDPHLARGPRPAMPYGLMLPSPSAARPRL